MGIWVRSLLEWSELETTLSLTFSGLKEGTAVVIKNY